MRNYAYLCPVHHSQIKTLQLRASRRICLKNTYPKKKWRYFLKRCPSFLRYSLNHPVCALCMHYAKARNPWVRWLSSPSRVKQMYPVTWEHFMRLEYWHDAKLAPRCFIPFAMTPRLKFANAFVDASWTNCLSKPHEFLFNHLILDEYEWTNQNQAIPW